MDALRVINTNLEECLNLAVSSTSSTSVTFPQQLIQSRVSTILESAKQLELWLVQETHRQKFSSSQSELERLRDEVAILRQSHELKRETLGKVLVQVPDWVKQLETLQTHQLRAMFELAPPLNDQANSGDAQRNRSTISTDDMWWGQQATDESEDL